MHEFILGGRRIGNDYPPLVIAELGINHEGQMDKAIELINAAAGAGAEVVKFQCHITETEMIRSQIKPGVSNENIWEIIKRCELTEDEESELKEYCEGKNIIYLSTPFSRESADRLERIGVTAYKIGSGECNNLPLLRYVASKGKPIILSTGMNDLKSIQESVGVICECNVPVALMHCTSIYPTPYTKVRLGAIGEIADAFPGIPVGLSDHSLNIWTCLGAVALGCSLLEKHFTVSRKWPGPDIAVSIEPHELGDLISGAQAIWEARGGEKNILADEQTVMDFAYSTVVTIRPVFKGEVFTEDNIWVKRPGTGPIRAKDLYNIIGKTAACDIPADNHVRPQHIRDYA